jgi:hypothetical protein
MSAFVFPTTDVVRGNMELYEMVRQSIPIHVCVFLVEKFIHLADGLTHPTEHKIVQICCKATSLILLVFLNQNAILRVTRNYTAVDLIDLDHLRTRNCIYIDRSACQ